MKKLLIIKTGENTKEICEIYGDFEDRIKEVLNLNDDEVKVWAVYKNEEKPDIQDVYAIIITGSYSMVSDGEAWTIMLSRWIKDIENLSIPTLGICFGHQIIADAFGGTVGYHTEGKEFGTVSIELTEEGIKDPLFSMLPRKFLGNVAHSQTVLTLPQNARLLARNDFEPHHGFAIKDHIWGVQFHPEFDSEYTLACIDACKEGLISDGYDIDKITSSVRENDYGKKLLQSFLQLAINKII